MRRVLRTMLVVVLVLFMSFNPATAWHFCGGGWGRHGGGRYSGHYASAYQSCYGGYCGSNGGGYGNVVYHDSYDGGCGSCGSDSYGGCDGYSDCGSCGSCGDGSAGCDGCAGGSCGYESGRSVIIESTPHESYEEVAPQDPVYRAPATTPPATVNRPMDTEPAPTLPQEPAPMPERTAEPLAPTPAEPADDLFGAPPAETTPPAEAPAEPATPPATEPPAETPAEEPDDLFGGETTPPAESALPAETPATESTTDDAGDLFGEPADAGATESTPETPAEEPEAPAEDMPAEETPTEETPAEDSTPAEDGGLDDLFGPTSDVSPVDNGVVDADAVLREPGGLASDEMREWVDNTGRFSCNGRLVNILDGHARLMKDNGRTTTVPLYRLSATDLAFLHRQASAQPQETFAQTANADAAEALTAN